MLETAVNSFVLRFVHELPGMPEDEDSAAWHGVIRHVQSDAELRFTAMEEALSFIAEYVPFAHVVEQTTSHEGRAQS